MSAAEVDAAVADGAVVPGEGTLTDGAIYERIVEAVLDHRLIPGTKLVEEKLGRAFGVSRTRIRHVLVRLASEQIVVLTPNRGASVACPTVEEAREVFAARALIEPTLVESFIAQAKAGDLRALKRNIEEEEYARRIGERHAVIRASGGFHLIIAERSGNRTLQKMLRELVSRTSLIIMTYGKPDHVALSPKGGCGSDEHRAMLIAMEARDIKAATRLMKRHLTHLEAHLDFGMAHKTRPDIGELFGERMGE
ncbi:MAG: GntR family transcriptional regulator [Moraxellaceae bacterium]|nr:GntR family transcriptional regulator [Moraxellaceae bacterium]